jgi:hypothetical protein
MAMERGRTHLYVDTLPNGQIYIFQCTEVNEGEDECETLRFDDIASVKELTPKLGDGLAIHQSTIANAGLGVFATRPYRKDEVVTYYDGRVMAFREFLEAELKDARYVSYARHLISRQWMIVGNQTDEAEWIVDPRLERLGRGVGAYINDGFPNENVTFTALNTNANWQRFLRQQDLLPTGAMVAITALRDIGTGEELFLSYGEQNRKRHGIPEPSFESSQEEEEESASAESV